MDKKGLDWDPQIIRYRLIFTHSAAALDCFSFSSKGTPQIGKSSGYLRNCKIYVNFFFCQLSFFFFYVSRRRWKLYLPTVRWFIQTIKKVSQSMHTFVPIAFFRKLMILERCLRLFVYLFFYLVIDGVHIVTDLIWTFGRKWYNFCHVINIISWSQVTFKLLLVHHLHLQLTFMTCLLIHN